MGVNYDKIHQALVHALLEDVGERLAEGREPSEGERERDEMLRLSRQLRKSGDIYESRTERAKRVRRVLELRAHGGRRVPLKASIARRLKRHGE